MNHIKCLVDGSIFGGSTNSTWFKAGMIKDSHASQDTYSGYLGIYLLAKQWAMTWENSRSMSVSGAPPLFAPAEENIEFRVRSWGLKMIKDKGPKRFIWVEFETLHDPWTGNPYQSRSIKQQQSFEHGSIGGCGCFLVFVGSRRFFK